MKILHTADWHLGQKLLQMDRHEEFRLALDWLCRTIQERGVDVLLVAGDIFDIGNPPNQARRLYYHFLRRLLGSGCRHVVITGGNHDSPAMLNAPRELLENFNIHVIGAATDDPADELLLLKNEAGAVELIVAAVPFLRDRDLRITKAGEDYESRRERLQEGLQNHYQTLAELAEAVDASDAPRIAMGHLYAKGAVGADKQDNIYVGDRENMEARQFPAAFDYVALGHIHRAQMVEDRENIRYSGSLIPLSFSETEDKKQVLILEFAGRELQKIEPVDVKQFRRLKTIQGDLEKVQQSLDNFAAKKDRLLRPWVDVIVDTDQHVPQLDQLLRDYTAAMNLDLVKIRVNRPYRELSTPLEEVPDLETLDVEEVFRRKCLSQGDLPEERLTELVDTFRELQNWMAEREA